MSEKIYKVKLTEAAESLIEVDHEALMTERGLTYTDKGFVEGDLHAFWIMRDTFAEYMAGWRDCDPGGKVAARGAIRRIDKACPEVVAYAKERDQVALAVVSSLLSGTGRERGIV